MFDKFSHRAFLVFKPAFFVLIMVLLCNPISARRAFAQAAQTQASTRKLKSSTPPDYPELARKMKIEGMARVLLTVSSDGSVVKVKELGGNPVLVDALAHAAHKWKYETAEHESEIEVRYEFVLKN
jgi:TonB family protein